MYRILIVDDEKDERDVIRFLIHKYKLELKIDEAANGKEALDKLKNQPVDILFTDIKMPFIDGIELATKVREQFPHLEIIFFSGHDDFNYLKKAIALKADNYILKPIKPVEFYNTMSTIIEQKEKRELEQQQRENEYALFKKQIIYELLQKTPIETLKSNYASVDFHFLDDYSRIFLIHFDEPFFDRFKVKEDWMSFQDLIKGVISKYEFDLVHFNRTQMVLLFKQHRRSLIPYMDMAHYLQRQIYKVYGMNCYISVSRDIPTFHSLSEIFDETIHYLEDRFFMSEKYVYPIDIGLNKTDSIQEQDQQLLQMVSEAIQYAEVDKLNQTIHQLFQKYDQKIEASHVYVRYLFTRLLQILFEETNDYPIDKMNQTIEAIYSCEFFSEIKNIVNQVQEKVLTRLEKKEESSQHVIDVVKHYIDHHYGEELNLDLLAAKVYLSPSYLSEKFIQETGYGISKYIKFVRMEHAKKLLITTNMKVIDISKTVGYQNYSYFCKSFREQIGLSPDKYRTQSKG